MVMPTPMRGADLVSIDNKNFLIDDIAPLVPI
jgi:hypothetical protein